MLHEGSPHANFREARAAEVAAGQWGNITTRQLRDVGFSKAEIHGMRARGLLHPRHRGLRVTTPAQTLLDLAAAGWPIERMTHDLAAASLVSLDDLRAFARNRRGEPGATRLNKALDLPHTRSDWERRFLRWIQTLEDIPQPILNDPSSTPTTPTAAPWKKRDDAERVWRVRRETWDRRRLAAGLRERLDPHVRTGAQSS